MENARATKAEMFGIELLLGREIPAMKSDVLDCIHAGETYQKPRSISSHSKSTATLGKERKKVDTHVKADTIRIDKANGPHSSRNVNQKRNVS